MSPQIKTTGSKTVIPLLLFLVAGLVRVGSGLGAHVLPQNWWTGMSADEILKKSEEITAGLESYRAYKPAKISTDQSLATEELFRRLPSGQTQKNTVAYRGGSIYGVEWDLAGTRYSYINGLLIQLAYKPTCWTEECLESCGHPFEWCLGGTERVGTNECLVIVGTASTELMTKARNWFGPVSNSPPSEEPLHMGQLPVERRVYIRAVDGIQLG